MAYHQAHLLMLAGYSSFFVSGLVLPKAEYPHGDEDHDVTMMGPEDEVDPSVVPQELNEPSATQVRSAPCSSPNTSKTASLPAAINGKFSESFAQGLPLTLAPVEKRRKRSLFADQSHVRTISRWLCETQPHCQAAEDRPRQHSMPDISAPVRIPLPLSSPTRRRQKKKTPVLTGDPFDTASRVARDQALLRRRRSRPPSSALHPDHGPQYPRGVNAHARLTRVG
ncbi:hypothetical protein IWZ00DRAFT_491076 [Phyllosticta capitalensis]|uniref:Uncharacterized protein n=1 Tax=Phyllosticta capitalensis TaxID=121624 RepID=A0ABR1YBD5_9PEZI